MRQSIRDIAAEENEDEDPDRQFKDEGDDNDPEHARKKPGKGRGRGNRGRGRSGRGRGRDAPTTDGEGTKQTNAASSAASQLEQLATDKSIEIKNPLPQHVLPGDLKAAAEVAEKLAEDDVKEHTDKTGEAGKAQEDDASSIVAEPDTDSKPCRKRKNEPRTAVKSAPKPKRAKTATPKKTKKSKKGTTPKKTKAKHSELSEDGEANAKVEGEAAHAAQDSQADAQPPMVATPKKKLRGTTGRPTTPKSKAGTPKKRSAKNQEPTICDDHLAKIIYLGLDVHLCIGF